MNVKPPAFDSVSIDPDDAPELTEEDLEKAVFTIAGRVVSREEGMAALRDAIDRPAPADDATGVPVMIDPYVLDALDDIGDEQGRRIAINAILRSWLLQHPEMAFPPAEVKSDPRT